MPGARGPIEPVYATTIAEHQSPATNAVAYQFASGGPLALTATRKVVFADAATGDVFSVSRRAATRIGRGPGTVPGLYENLVRGEPGALQIWWSFPKTILLATGGSNEYLIAVSRLDESNVDLYRVEPKAPAEHIGRFEAMFTAAASFDRITCVVVSRDSHGSYSIARLRYPSKWVDSL
jgi:hypothetical protein